MFLPAHSLLTIILDSKPGVECLLGSEIRVLRYVLAWTVCKGLHSILMGLKFIHKRHAFLVKISVIFHGISEHLNIVLIDYVNKVLFCGYDNLCRLWSDDLGHEYSGWLLINYLFIAKGVPRAYFAHDPSNHKRISLAWVAMLCSWEGDRVIHDIVYL